MTCNDCETTPRTTYFRWGTTNLGLCACDKHLKEVMDVLRTAQKRRKK